MNWNRIGIIFISMIVLNVTDLWATTSLYHYAFNIDGTINYDSWPSGMDMTGFDTATGIGTIIWTTDDAGDHSFLSFFDIDIAQSSNGFTNETGSASGNSSSGQSWEIDEPGYYFGDIYNHFLNNQLDNDTFAGTDKNGNNYNLGNGPQDVSWAMGWDFTLAADETALITLTLTETLPDDLPAFYLTQYDTNSHESVYFFGTLEITGGGGGPAPVPEPSTIILMGMGLVGITGTVMHRRKR